MTEAPRRRRALTAVGGRIHRDGSPEVAALLAEALDAVHSVDADELTHGFHSWPARMHPGIARVVLASQRERNPIVLDPFCGSGTVLVEAEVAALRATGVDLNPLAIRVAEIRCQLRGPKERMRFVETLRGVAMRSEERVRARVYARAPIPRSEAHWYDGHVLKELAGLREEILTVEPPDDRRALEVLLSAVLVKFSRQKADTSQRMERKRIRKGLVTEFYLRRGEELAERWGALREATPEPHGRPPRLREGDARRLPELVGRARFDLILTSPPYGGTYDYAEHHARRYPWLGLDPRGIERSEIGARRRLRRGEDADRWDEELLDVLRSLEAVCNPGARLVLLLGDGQIGPRRVDADAQIRRLVTRTGMRWVATASQDRPDHTGRSPRREHLIALGTRRRP